jgi:hypothetical protein
MAAWTSFGGGVRRFLRMVERETEPEGLGLEGESHCRRRKVVRRVMWRVSKAREKGRERKVDSEMKRQLTVHWYWNWRVNSKARVR